MKSRETQPRKRKSLYPRLDLLEALVGCDGLIDHVGHGVEGVDVDGPGPGPAALQHRDLVPDRSTSRLQELGDVGEEGDAHEVGDQEENCGDDHGVEEVAGEVLEVQVRSQSKPTRLVCDIEGGGDAGEESLLGGDRGGGGVVDGLPHVTGPTEGARLRGHQGQQEYHVLQHSDKVRLR